MSGDVQNNTDLGEFARHDSDWKALVTEPSGRTVDFNAKRCENQQQQDQTDHRNNDPQAQPKMIVDLGGDPHPDRACDDPDDLPLQIVIRIIILADCIIIAGAEDHDDTKDY